MGLGEFVGVIYFVWLAVVGFGLRYLAPLVFPSIPFNSLTSSVSVEGCKRITEGKKERDEGAF